MPKVVQKKTKSGRVYEVKGYPYNSIEIYFGHPDNKRQSFNYADLQEIINKECKGNKPEDIRIYCHSGAGMQISCKNPSDSDED